MKEPWPFLRLKLIEELKKQINWLNERDPKRQSERMNGARYAYHTCIKRLKKL